MHPRRCAPRWSARPLGASPRWDPALLLICFHFDPATGRYSLEVLKVLRLAGIFTILTIAGMLFLLYRGKGGAA